MSIARGLRGGLRHGVLIRHREDMVGRNFCEYADNPSSVTLNRLLNSAGKLKKVRGK